MTLRHCMVVHNSYPYAETRVEREASALVGDGIEVDLICLRLGNEPKEETIGGVRIYRLPVSRDKNRGQAGQLLEYLAFFVLAFFKLIPLTLRQRYDSVQVHNLPDFLVFAALFPKLMGSRIILDLHDLMPEFYLARYNGAPNDWRSRLIGWQEKLSCRFANHVITVTEPWRQMLIKRGVPPQKCSVVMNLANDQIFHLEPGANRQFTHNSQFRLIYHGTLSQRYGIDVALQALDLVRNDIPGVTLTIHGRGEYLNTLRQLTADLRLVDFVQFSDQLVATDQLPRLIAGADVGIVPYRRDVFTDGILPTKLLEYASLCMPVIAARTPAISAYFDETMVEFFVSEDVKNLASCILRLYRDPSRREKLSENIQKFNQRYNWASHKLEYIHLVRGLQRS